MRFLPVLAIAICCNWSMVAGAIVCLDGDNQYAAMSQECDDADTECYFPKLSYNTGLSDYGFGCGSCPADAQDTCDSCEGNEDYETPCNTVKTPHSFSCHSFYYDDEESRWRMNTDGSNNCYTNPLDGIVVCNKPGNVAPSTYEVPYNGCGPCRMDDMGTEGLCEECYSDNCNTIPEPIQCNQGSGQIDTVVSCAAGVTTCTGPFFLMYTGVTDHPYGCGVCAPMTEETCNQCTGSTESPCNTEVTATDFSCYTYSFDEVADKFIRGEVKNCPFRESMTGACNRPGVDATESYSVPYDGCGPCSVDDTNLCEDCDTENCNIEYIMCNEANDDGLLEPVTCTISDTTCTSPKLVRGSGLSSQAYGCGACPPGTEATCAECTGSTDSPCNTEVEENSCLECSANALTIFILPLLVNVLTFM